MFFVENKLNKPLDIDRDAIQFLEGLLANWFRDSMEIRAKLVIAVSSNYALFLNVSTSATLLRDLMITSTVYTTTAMSDAESSKVLSHIDDDHLRNSVMKKANNIPKLLRLWATDGSTTLQMFDKAVSQVAHNEFFDTLKYIKKKVEGSFMLDMEAKLLLAIWGNIPYHLFGISEMMATQSQLVKSYLVSINTEVPKLYLPFLNEQLEIFATFLMHAHWAATSNLTTNNVNVINDFFESSIATVLVPKLKCRMRSRNSDKEEVLELNFSSLPLSFPPSKMMTTDVLYQTSTYHKAIDYVAVKQNIFGETENNTYLICFSVTAQQTKMREKMTTSVNIQQMLTERKKGVILFFINPNHPDFEENFKLFEQATNSTSATVKKKFSSWWFAQPLDMEPVQALYSSLTHILKRKV